MANEEVDKFDISPYIAIIDRFLAGEIAAASFARTYMKMMKSETRMLGDAIYPVLQDLFGDADAYVEQPDLRTDSEDLDENDLLACARRARERLPKG